jgi:MOSC domain-containing protein YiiM
VTEPEKTPRPPLSTHAGPVTAGEGATGTVVSVNIAERKTVRKKPVGEAELVFDRGVEGDAHAGDWHRQVSLLAMDKMRAAGLDVGAGDFAENITTQGIDLLSLPIGTRLAVGDDVLLEISQIGKVCHTHCAIYYQAGDCVMPREGIFAVVRRAGRVAVGDRVTVTGLGDGTCDRVPADAETPQNTPQITPQEA